MKQVLISLLACFLPLFAKAETRVFPKTQTDTIAPTIFCPPTDTLNLSVGACQTIYNFSIIATDDSGTPPLVSQVSGIASGQNFPVGKTVQVFRATDLAGNSSSCSFEVFVRHFKIFPICDDLVTVPLDENCTFPNLDPLVFLENSQIGCPTTYQFHLDKQAPYGNGPWLVPQIGTDDRNKTYGFRITDPQHATQCWGLIKFKDTQPPVISCQNLTVSTAIRSLKPEIWRDSAGIAGAVPLAADNCSPLLNFYYVDVNQSFPCDSAFDGRITRRWYATDADGNTGTCTQYISLSHVQFDNVIFPADTLLACETGKLPSPENTGRPFIQIGNLRSQYLGKIGATFTDTDTTICAGTQVIQRQWTLVNWCTADVVEYTQTVGTQDKKPPTLTCPDQKITLSGTATGCTVQVQLPEIAVSDECSSDLQTTVFWSPTDSANATAYSLGFALFDLLPLSAGQQTLSLRATDECGNSKFCQFEAQILDGQPPTVACKNLQQIQLGAAGTAQIAASQLSQMAVDACSPQLSFKAKRLPPTTCLPANNFSDAVNFCCADEGNVIEIALRVFDFEVPAGEVAANFGQGQFSECTAQVAVVDNQPPTCTAPPDLTVTCAQFDVAAPLILEGFARSCSAADAEFVWDFSQFDSICETGAVIQTLRVPLPNGQFLDCSRQVFVQFDTAAAMGWAVRFPDDVQEKFCINPSKIGSPEILGNACGQVAISFTDLPISKGFDRRWKIFNRCLLGDDPPATNFFTVQNFTSTLVGRTLAGADAPPQFTNTPFEWSRRLDGFFYNQQVRSDNSSDGYFLKNCEPTTPATFNDSQFQNDPNLWANPAWTNPITGLNDLSEMPVSFSTEIEACDPATQPTHFILKLNLDQNQVFEIQIDSRNPPPPGKVMLSGTLLTFDQRPVPDDQKFQFTIKFDSLNANRRLARMMWHTPADPDVFYLPQLPHGEHFFEWVVASPPPATDSKNCSIAFKILPPSQKFDVHGRVATDQNVGLNASTIELTPMDLPLFPATFASLDTDTSGTFNFPKSVWQGANYEITPKNNLFPLNGITTYDLLLISRHILGTQPLTNPYRIIAADVNRSGSVTTNDIVELRKMILGINTTFSSNTSWRFVPKSWTFSNPQNPFVPQFPEVIERQLVLSNFQNEDFVAIKTGDVNGNANPHLDQFLVNEDREMRDEIGGDAPVFCLETADREFASGENFEVKLLPNQPTEAWQMTLESSANLKIVAGKASNLVVFEKENRLTAAVFGDEARQPLIFKMQATRSGRLSENLFLSDQITRREAVLPDGRVGKVGLRFFENEKSAGLEQARLLDIFPNPFEKLAAVRFVVPESRAGERLRISVSDGAGRLVLEREFVASAGLNLLPLDFSAIGGAGVFIGKIAGDGGFSDVFRLVKL